MYSWFIVKAFLKKTSLNIANEESKQVKERADSACVNRFFFTHHWDMERCSEPITFKGKIDWTYCYNGDEEWAFMLNRQRFMADIGQAYIITEDENYVKQWKRIFYEWVEANKDKSIHPFTYRKIDTGIRLTNWLKGYACIHDSTNWLPYDDKVFKEQVEAQGNFLYETFTAFDFQSNWGFLEVNGLLQAAFMMDQRLREQWLQISIDRLEKMILLQIYKDGIQKEQSPMYHHEVLHCLMEISIVLRRNKIQIPSFIEDATNQMLTAYYQIMKPNGHQPMLGDSDDTDIRSTLAIGAVLFHRPDLRALAGNNCPLDILWYFGEEGVERFESMEQKLPLETTYNLLESGITIFRSGWDLNDNYLLFDHGSMGQVNKGHGHDDNLHIELMMEGREFLIDGGRYTYCETEERKYFKCSHRHNTVTVDGHSASDYLETWKWENAAKPIDYKYRFTDAYQYAQAGHTGFWRLAAPAHITRKIIVLSPSSYFVIDCFESKGLHNYTQHFHFGEQTPVELLENKRIITTFKDYNNISIIPLQTPEEVGMEEGFTSRHYNELTQHPHVQFKYKQKQNLIAPVLIQSVTNRHTNRVVYNQLPVYHINGSPRSNEEVVAFKISDNNRDYLIVCSLVGSDSFLVENYQLCGELILITDVKTHGEKVHVIQ
ncbi:alginate lyase family protein [Virgibacillus halodenitrificans]|uniref:Alginate lyase family protein n=1 Tax=Virgibacillus halodenitrificans TaxID=1482 RepID=A0ABR7VSX3_VIRHA|nr:alginate lyase family protein [Virgibacillus halodenitrificans]MBD1223847.1 alginate lyase family protein [Virgibacillus halodenitrificans]